MSSLSKSPQEREIIDYTAAHLAGPVYCSMVERIGRRNVNLDQVAADCYEMALALAKARQHYNPESPQDED